MRILGSSLVMLTSGLENEGKDVAFCDLKWYDVFDEFGETDFKFDCNSKFGKSFSKKRRGFKFYRDPKTGNFEPITCTVSCRFDRDQRKTLEIRAKTDDIGICDFSFNLHDIRWLCGEGCLESEIIEKMGNTASRSECSRNDPGGLVKPGRRCRFECPAKNGEILKTGRKLLCVCSGPKLDRQCQWAISKKPFWFF